MKSCWRNLLQARWGDFLLTSTSYGAEGDGEVIRADENQRDNLLLCAWLGKIKERLGLSALPKSEYRQPFTGHSPSGNAFEKE